MIEVNDNNLLVSGQKLPHGDILILKQLLRVGPVSAFKLMELTGKMYVQYIQYRLRVLSSPLLSGIVIKSGRGLYEINPEIKEELIKALEGIK